MTKPSALSAALRSAIVNPSENTVAAFANDFRHSLRLLKAEGYDVPSAERRADAPLIRMAPVPCPRCGGRRTEIKIKVPGKH